MKIARVHAALAAIVLMIGGSFAGTASPAAAASGPPPAKAMWPQRDLAGTVRLTGQVPLLVKKGITKALQPHAMGSNMGLNFALPLRDKAGLNALIMREARTHHYLTRAQLYQRFSPSKMQFRALNRWLVSEGFQITHLSRDRLAITAHAPTATVERAMSVRINDYVRPAFSFEGLRVAPYAFFSNTVAPTVPARLGIQSISGLSNVDRFFTDYQLAHHGTTGRARSDGSSPVDCDQDPQNPLCIDVRSGGYFPGDVRSLYDVAGHGYDGTGQTLGFTLWGAGEYQPALTGFASATGDTAMTDDTPCVATGTPSTPSPTCVTTHVAGDHLLNILENGNTNNQFGGSVETALDIEQAHGIATHAGLKYYLADCTSSPPVGSGLSNGSNCNGSDVGLEDAIDDAANDPTLHTVSDSWAFGGEAEWGNADPFLLASENSFAIAAAAGTTFYFSTGDSGTYQSGYPSDSQYVVAVGGTTLFSTSSTSTRSTEDTWAAGGSWCSNLEARPAWQTGLQNASCPGREIPDVSAVADTNSSVRYVDSTSPTATGSGGVGGTSVAAPELNGMEAVTESFIQAQTYPGPTPQIGFEGPIMYALGNTGQNRYFNDVLCGNTASPSGGPDGDAAVAGWDPATGWGSLDWYNYSIGYAMQLGASNLSLPSSVSPGHAWSCMKTPGNAAIRGISCPTTSSCYAVGAVSGTPWFGKFISSGADPGTANIYKSSNGGLSWSSQSGDMLSVACTSSSTCVEVGDGGRIRTTADGGTTWTDVFQPFNKALYGLTCPNTTVCYTTDIYAHVMKTSDGGASWTLETTPVTTPGLAVPGSGGPNPFAGLFGISCLDQNNCVAVGGYPPSGTDPPIVTTSNGGASWTLRTSNSGSGNYLHSVACIVGSTTCYAVGRGGSIVTSVNSGVTWTKMTSPTSSMLDSVSCVDTTDCVATGQSGVSVVLSGTTWSLNPAVAGTPFLAGVTCLSATTCLGVGSGGVTYATQNGGGSWLEQAGGRQVTNAFNAVSCASSLVCFAAGAAGSLQGTSNGGQTWLAQTSGTSSALNGISCSSTTTCVAAGAGGVVTRTTNGGASWATQTSGTTQALNGVSCTPATSNCVAVGASGTVIISSTGGGSWTTQASGTTQALSAVTCPTASCIAAGAAGTIITSGNSGSSWTSRTSGTANSFSGVGCIDSTPTCFAGGASGTISGTTDGGTTWALQGNPLYGPVSAPNAGPTSIIQINATGCSPIKCFMGTASSGNIMAQFKGELQVTAPTLAVPYGTTPSLTPSYSGFTGGDNAGSLANPASCSTTAGPTSNPGTYPTQCPGSADSDYYIANYAGVMTIVKADQAITFGTLPDRTYQDAPFIVSATGGGSSNPVTFSAVGNCTSSGTNGSTITISGAGSCTVTAAQAGTIDYNNAPSVSQSFSIAQYTPVLSWNQPGDITYPTALSGTQLDATADVAGVFTYSPPSGTVLDAGPNQSLSATFTPTDTADYVSGGTASTTISVDQYTPVLTWLQPADITYPTALSATQLDATADVPGVFVYSPASTTVLNAGPNQTLSATFTPTDTQNDVSGGTASTTINVLKGNQTITFGALADKTYEDPDFNVTATASSGLSVSFSAVGACTVTGNTVHLLSSGVCTITASQAGDANWNPATSVSQSFSIAVGPVSLTSTTALQLFAQGKVAAVSATLKDGSGNPISGRSILITVGPSAAAAGNSCTGLTNGSGVAACSFTLSASLVPQGNNGVTDSFAGDAYYHSAGNNQSALVYAFTSTGAFVVGDKTATGSVNWWGSQWANNNVLSGGSAPSSMKGFASNTPSLTCGSSYYTTTTGNSSTPPATVPGYMAVAVSSKVTQSGSTINGNIVHMVIVKTNPGYANDPSHPGTGTVVAQIC